ncbi:MAG: 1-acyl-sn-glycerol-3-phosphate acyltransferase [Betaproteobacteria bacterium]|nr:1-acyl-sn-glycerol-3-phosphate acyltransferase [Betaproteobacteria bacterium]
MAVLRSTLFAAVLVIITPLFAAIALLTFALPALTRYRIITVWSRCVVWAARVLCGIRYRVVGAEHLPRQPCIILSKHQSAWETLALQLIFPPQVWVLKKELLRVPFFGWGLAMLSPIAIDRSARREALQQLIEQGRERLAAGFCIVIFPEGTRIAPGQRGKYRPGGTRLAVETATPVIPVAHNAGLCWGRNAFIKRPGLVTVSIGSPIDPQGMNADQLARRVEDWIEGEMPRLDSR